MVKTDYKVRLYLDGYVEYLIHSCNTPEEAQSVAEDLLDEDLDAGGFGNSMKESLEIVEADIEPVDGEEEE